MLDTEGFTFGSLPLAAQRLDTGAGTRPVRRPGRHRRLPGHSDAFDKSITDFCERYADQNERDYQEFVTAFRSGRLQAVEGV